MQEISFNSYFKKVKGCFTGKAVGGTLGMPMEGFIGVKEIKYYDPIPTEMVANDDLDIQVVWLETVKRFGLPINRYNLGKAFERHVLCVMDEYTAAVRNMNNGINPPLSGYYDNKFYAGMGSTIRTEIWACLAPGDPHLAAMLSREDACVDHCLDGVDSTMFVAAVESAAFIESDPWKLVQVGLSVISKDCKVYNAVNSVMKWVKDGLNILDIRKRVLITYFAQNWTDVVINLSFIVAGLLTYGGDISKGLCDVAGLGHDADCTCATLGSIFGIINPDGFEERWIKPLGDDLVLSPSIGSIHEVNTITEFSNQIIEICPEILAYYNSETTITGVRAYKESLLKWTLSDKNLTLTDGYNPLESVVSLTPITVKLTYPEKVAIAPGKSAEFKASFFHPNGGNLSAKVHLSVPHGWNVSPSDFDVEINGSEESVIEFTVTASDDLRRRRAKNPLDIRIQSGDLNYCVSAGLMQTIDFICTPFVYSPEKVPNAVITKSIATINAVAHYFKVERCEQLLSAEFRSPHFVSSAILIAQGTRAMRVWVDNRLVLEHDGGEYVPAFHRSEYVAVLNLDDKWHRLTVWVDAQDFDGKGEDNNPHNAVVTVPNSLTTPEYRRKYEQFTYEPKKGEVFIGFADRSGYRWLHNLEWRLPKDNSFFKQ